MQYAVVRGTNNTIQELRPKLAKFNSAAASALSWLPIKDTHESASGSATPATMSPDDLNQIKAHLDNLTNMLDTRSPSSSAASASSPPVSYSPAGGQVPAARTAAVVREYSDRLLELAKVLRDAHAHQQEGYGVLKRTGQQLQGVYDQLEQVTPAYGARVLQARLQEMRGSAAQ